MIEKIVLGFAEAKGINMGMALTPILLNPVEEHLLRVLLLLVERFNDNGGQLYTFVARQVKAGPTEFEQFTKFKLLADTLNSPISPGRFVALFALFGSLLEESFDSQHLKFESIRTWMLGYCDKFFEHWIRTIGYHQLFVMAGVW